VQNGSILESERNPAWSLFYVLSIHVSTDFSRRTEPDFGPWSHATLRAFVAALRTVRGFFRDGSVAFLALGAALAEGGNSSLGCFAVRW
jgi:hypothetical protein